ncbi:MAG: membrane integrity-associated transporter subunit PqiC [Alphaproteobacteria bacterium]|nr:membrane integrity-associated transporter subunit PqiC [Alphaproteobacteria bacterium]
MIGPPPAPQIYALHPALSAMRQGPPLPWQLVVAQPVTPEVLDTQRIALERAPNLMDFFANAQWTDRLPLLLQSLLIEAFEVSQTVSAVGREGGGLRADYVLATEIRNFHAYYEVIDSPPKIKVAVAAKLVAAPTHDLVRGTEIQREVPTSANDLPSITAAFGQAAGDMAEALVTWTMQGPRGSLRGAG